MRHLRPRPGALPQQLTPSLTDIVPDAALGLWAETAGGLATLINLSENHTFRIDAGARRFALRLHRPGYQSRSSIESELAWLTALHDLPVVRPLPGRNGDVVQQVAPGRHAVLFAWEQGSEPPASPELFATLGRYAATMHSQAADWPRPPDFVRPRWDAENMLAPDGLWGDWRQGPHVAAFRQTLDAVDHRLRQDLATYGTTPDRFGLIHADMRLANLLDDGQRTLLLDFDDCGFGWHLYDLAASLSFIDEGAAALTQAWRDGYQALRPLSAEDLAMIEPLILLRRMVLLAWIGSHGETDLARVQAPTFARETARLGAIYLGR